MRRLWLVLLAACGRLNFDAHGDAATADTPYDGPNRVFVTSATMNGNLGGRAGANEICQQTADDARLDGEFVALLFEMTSLPSAPLVGSRGWVNLGGKPVADLPGEFDSAATLNPILYDEHGIATYALAHIGDSGATCGDWTESVGIGSVSETSEALWMQTVQSGGCGEWHLYCAERGRSVPVTPNVGAGRIAFLTDTLFAPGGGLAAADTLCTTDAAAAGLPAATYRAFLGSSSGGPETRFAANGEPWRRVDGVVIGDPARLLSVADDVYLDTFITRTASGQPWDTSDIWNGRTTHCSDWMTTAGDGHVGRPGKTRVVEFRGFIDYPCTFTFRVLCLQL